MGSDRDDQRERDELIDAFIRHRDSLAAAAIGHEFKAQSNQRQEVSPSVAAVSATITQMLVIFLDCIVRENEGRGYDRKTGKRLEKVIQSVDKLWEHLVQGQHEHGLAHNLVDFLVRVDKEIGIQDARKESEGLLAVANLMFRDATGEWLDDVESELLFGPPDVPEENDGPVQRFKYRVGKLMDRGPRMLGHYRKKPLSAFPAVRIDDETLRNDELGRAIVVASLAELCFGCTLDELTERIERIKLK